MRPDSQGSLVFLRTYSQRKHAEESVVDRALESPELQSVAGEFDELTLHQRNSLQLEIEKLDGSDEVLLRQVAFFLSDGLLLYTESQSGNTSASFHFDLEKGDVIDELKRAQKTAGKASTTSWSVSNGSYSMSPTSTASSLKDKYSDVPSGTNGVIFGREKRPAAFRRSATKEEQKLIKRADLEGVSDDAEIVLGSDLDGYRVVETEEDGENKVAHITDVAAKSSGSVSSLSATAGSVDASELYVSERHVESLDHKDRFYDHPCFGPCVACAGSLGSCIACSPTCAGAPTGVGAVACAACLFIVCRAVLYTTCVACAVCFNDHPP